MMSKIAELVFVPAPAIGHLVSMVEMAKLLISRNQHLSVTVLVANFPYNTGVTKYLDSLFKHPISRLKIVTLPDTDPSTYATALRHYILTALIDSHKHNIRDIASSITRTESTRLAAFVVDILSITAMDIADEFNVPTYVYCPAGAAFLGLGLHLQSLFVDDKNDLSEFRNSDELISVPSFSKRVPAKVLPSSFLDKEGGSELMLGIFRKFRDAKGIIVNSFVELESFAFDSLAADPKIPKVFSVGPVLNLAGEGHDGDEVKEIMSWLDGQSAASVVFLCFGSFGGFHEDQIKEMAIALERSGHNFLWSLRPPFLEFKPNYTNLSEILPPGFLDRTSSTGKIIGWAPQVTVLSHNAVGGFMSHCGWNSTLESLWHGVPIATWPLYAEQQLNAFELVNELGLGVEIGIEYSNEFSMMSKGIVKADEIEVKIRELMGDENVSEVRKKVKKIKEMSRAAVLENGSSYNSLEELIEKIV